MQKTPLRAIGIAVLVAIGWWLLAMFISAQEPRLLLWDDQKSTFWQVSLSAPYSVDGFLNPPHTVIFLFPLRFFSLPIAVLLQWVIYCVCLAVMVFHFGARRPWLSLAVIFSSILMLDNALELNIDWLVAVALIVPPVWSAPFLLVKPQVAIGYLIGFRWRDLVRWVGVVCAIILASFLIWGNWLEAWQANSAEKTANQVIVNFAPMHLLGVVPSLVIGLGLLAWAWRKRDGLLGVIASLFFMPYLAVYSLLIPFALFAIRYPWWAGCISAVTWFILGQIVFFR